MEGIKRRGAAVAATALGIAALAPGVAFAKITPANCENPGGNLPGGQQPVCKGEGQTQNPATNPAGNAPPGQQP